MGFTQKRARLQDSDVGALLPLWPGVLLAVQSSLWGARIRVQGEVFQMSFSGSVV